MNTKKTARGNMMIAQSGGPSMVINRSLIGAVTEAKRHGRIRGIFGSLHGIKGILEENIVDLRKETPATLDAVAGTPASALGTVRKKPTAEDCRAIFDTLRRYGVSYFFYIGGNDSAETAHIIGREAASVSSDLKCFHIPKTIDNDLRENDHTPGFGSAARYVACALMGDDLDNRALPGVKIDVVMGRHAGFLTAAAALGRRDPDDGPHLIYCPERPFDPDRFAGDVQRIYRKYGRCVAAVSEGIADERGEAIAGKFLKETDSHGNTQLSGSSALGDMLAAYIKEKTNIGRVRADTLGYMQRSFPGIISVTDSREAWEVGVRAVRYAMTGQSGSVVIRRKSTKKYAVSYECVPLEKVARETRHMPPSFFNRAGNNVTKAFLDYAMPLIGELPAVGKLKCVKVKRA